MKKIFTFCFFAFALLLGTQSATAQKQLSTSEKALKSAKELRSQIKLDGDTFQQLYKAFEAYESKIASLKSVTKPGSQFNQDKKLISQRLQENLKKILGSDAYKRYAINAMDANENEEIRMEMKESLQKK